MSNKVLAKFGFKKIWLEKHGRFIELWGEFNSRVLLMREDADGNKTVQVDDDGNPMYRDLNSADYKKKGIGGKIKLVETKYLFSEENYILYDEGDDEDLKYFRPLDYPTPETYVGFIIKPDVIYKSLYYMSVSNYELNNLDLDYEGYTQMAVESRVFNHWQRVLLYYMNGEGIGSVETETFKTEMPKIFPDWTWENFIAKFESLRLSNKNK